MNTALPPTCRWHDIADGTYDTQHCRMATRSVRRYALPECPRTLGGAPSVVSAERAPHGPVGGACALACGASTSSAGGSRSQTATAKRLRVLFRTRARARIAKLATRAQMRDRQQMRQHSPASALLIIMQPPTVWHGPERPKSMTRGWRVLDGWVVVWSASMPRTHVLVVWRPVVVVGN